MKTNVLTVILYALCACITGCDNKSNQGTNSAVSANTTTAETRSLGLPSDYFPTTIGSQWTYEIKVTDTKNTPPLEHQITEWPRGKQAQVMETRGLLYPHSSSTNGHIRLSFHVESQASKQGPLEYPEGYKVEIDRDDLNFFGGPVELFWAIRNSDEYNVTMVAMFDPARTPGAPSGGPWGTYGQEKGYAMRILLFGGEPMTELSFSKKNDALLFVGPELVGNTQTLHYRRSVKESKPPEGISNAEVFDAAFNEDLWYVKGVGLTKLVQTVNGTTTMTWDLIEFNGKAQQQYATPTSVPDTRRRL